MLELDVPFYSNTQDDTHCFQAGIKSVLKYFLPERDFTWEELDKLTAKKGNLWTWPMAATINLKKMGFEAVSMTDFDYKRFSEEGGAYLVEKFGEEKGKAQIEHSDIEQERRLAKSFMSYSAKREIYQISVTLKVFSRKDIS